MSNLASLTAQREGLLKKIRAIEASCEGIENENNAKRVQKLNLEQAQYSAQRQEIAAKLAVLDGNLANINAEILELSGERVSKKFLRPSRTRDGILSKTNLTFFLIKIQD